MKKRIMSIITAAVIALSFIGYISNDVFASQPENEKGSYCEIAPFYNLPPIHDVPAKTPPMP